MLRAPFASDFESELKTGIPDLSRVCGFVNCTGVCNLKPFRLKFCGCGSILRFGFRFIWINFRDISRNVSGVH